MDEHNNALPQAPNGGTPEEPKTETTLAETPSVASPADTTAASAGSSSPASTTAPTPSTSGDTITNTSPTVPSVTDTATPSTNTVPAAATAEPEAQAQQSAPVSDSAPVVNTDTVVPAPVNDVATVPASSPAAIPAPAASEVTPQTNASSAGPAHEKRHMGLPKLSISRKSIGLFLIIVILLASLGSSVYFAIGQKNAKKEIDSLNQKIASLDANTHDLPEGAVKLSECVPNMGFHYLEQGADPKFGPLTLVSNKGKVIGYEYMFNNSMLTKVPDAEIPLEVLLTNGPVLLHDYQYNSIDFSRATAGHPGFEDDHYDVHLYTVDPEVQKQACE